jgi:hypothetical protein
MWFGFMEPVREAPRPLSPPPVDARDQLAPPTTGACERLKAAGYGVVDVEGEPRWQRPLNPVLL